MPTPGEFGEFGGRHVPEPLEEPLAELAASYEDAIADPEFMAEFRDLLEHFAGRPTPIFHAETLSERTAQTSISNMRICFTVVPTSSTTRSDRHC